MTIRFKRDECRVIGDHNHTHMVVYKNWWMVLPVVVTTFVLLLTCTGTSGQMNGADAFVATSIITPDWKYNNDRMAYTTTCCSNPLTKTSTTLCMGRKVTIRIVGRKQGGEEWLEEACDMYLQRLKPTGFEVYTEWYKSNDALLKVHHEQSSSQTTSKHVPIVLLDPTGIRCTSESFTDKVYQWLEEGGSRLVFVVGGGT